MKYRQKPPVVEAFQWTGGADQVEDPGWMIDRMKRSQAWTTTGSDGSVSLLVCTRGGVTPADPGDYIVMDASGNLDVMTPERFTAAYELMESAP